MVTNRAPLCRQPFLIRSVAKLAWRNQFLPADLLPERGGHFRLINLIACASSEVEKMQVADLAEPVVPNM